MPRSNEQSRILKWLKFEVTRPELKSRLYKAYRWQEEVHSSHAHEDPVTLKIAANGSFDEFVLATYSMLSARCAAKSAP
jgi:hypothetical protein